MDKNFIATSDEDTANLLRTMGFEEISHVGNTFWTFINQPAKYALFSEDMKHKTVLTNVLTMS